MLSATALADAIRARQLSCVEVMSAYLDHIERINPLVNAIVALRDRDDLLAEAKEKDTQLARGDATGPLHGLPFAVKDLFPVKGMRTTLGSLVLKDFVASADNVMVARSRKAGAIIIGKTNTPEFGLGSHTYNEVYGATRNAYDQSRSAGTASVTIRPWISTLPLSGRSRPAIRRNVVVLPAPVGPSSTTNSPLVIESERLRTASTAP